VEHRDAEDICKLSKRCCGGTDPVADECGLGVGDLSGLLEVGEGLDDSLGLER
jgi:hypothetical protein